VLRRTERISPTDTSRILTASDKEGRRRILIAPSITTGLVVMPHFSHRLVIALPGVIDY
jgi:hypothetical protein